MLRRFVQAIISAWDGGKPVSDDPATSNIPHPVDEPLPPSETDVLRDRLAEIADHNDRVLTDALHYISLEDVRDALGESWGALSLQVTTLAAHQLQRWLRPADSFNSHGEVGFLLDFDGLDHEEGKRQAACAALRLKGVLVRQFPQLTDAAGVTAASDPPAAGRQQADSSQLAKVAHRVNQAQDRAGNKERGLWRAAVGQATLDLLEGRTVVTRDTLIGRLEAARDAGAPVLKLASIDAAITRLAGSAPDTGASDIDPAEPADG